MKNKTAIVIVTYNPEISNIQKVLKELCNYRIFVYDNNSRNSAKLKELVSHFVNVNLFLSKSNKGIAAAQNEAIKKIMNDNKEKYIFFLDQDSFITDEELFKLEKNMIYLQNKHKKIGVLAASTDNLNNQAVKFEYLNEVISSGMLIPISVLSSVGLMKEKFFIDMVDYEWCWRAENKGYSVIKDNSIKFYHQIGTKNRILRKIPIAPFRLYYVFRNTIYMLNTNYLPHNYGFKLRFGLFKQIIFNLVFCSNRVQRVKYIIKGIEDGKKRKLGQLDE